MFYINFDFNFSLSKVRIIDSNYFVCHKYQISQKLQIIEKLDILERNIHLGLKII